MYVDWPFDFCRSTVAETILRSPNHQDATVASPLRELRLEEDTYIVPLSTSSHHCQHCDSACHRVINNQELIHMIFGFIRASVEAETKPRRRRNTVTPWQKAVHRFLTVNKSLYETTVELLWENLGSLLPVFDLLPSFKAEGQTYVSLPVM